MSSQRVRITLTFEVDLDPVPGRGHEPRDWEEYVKERLAGNNHYHPETTIKSADLIGPPDPMARLVANYLQRP